MKTLITPPLIILLGVFDVAAKPAPWNQFRGPAGSGVAEECQPPLTPGEGNLAWKIPVPPGLSSPVLTDDLVVLTAMDSDRLVTAAYRRESGELAWRRMAPEVAIERVHRTSHPAAPTPFCGKDQIFVYFGSYGLLCYDHQGAELWSRPVKTPKSLYGTASSPIVHQNRLFLVVDNDADLPDSKLSQSVLLAVDTATGEIAWESPRPFNRSGWSTPSLWKRGGEDELLVLGNGRASGYDPATGSERWFVTGFSRETIAIPVTGNGHVYFSAAQLGGGADENPDPKPFWAAVMRFDANADGQLEPSEMTGHFTYPLRPDLPLGHPGFGFPLPRDPGEREKRRQGIFGWVDKNRDGFWTEQEFADHMSSRRGNPRLVAIRPGGEGDITESHTSWELRRGIPEIPSPLFHEGIVYLIRDGGLLTAVNAQNGEPHYSERVGASGGYSASPVLAQNHLYLLSNRGTLTVAKTGPGIEISHQLTLDEPVQVTPAIDRNTLYIRTGSHLWAFRSPGSGGR